MEKELLLFSGGPDSTVLLKYFLTIKKPLIVLHIQMGWCNELQPRLKTQKKSKKGNYFSSFWIRIESEDRQKLEEMKINYSCNLLLNKYFSGRVCVLQP